MRSSKEEITALWQGNAFSLELVWHTRPWIGSNHFTFPFRRRTVSRSAQTHMQLLDEASAEFLVDTARKQLPRRSQMAWTRRSTPTDVMLAHGERAFGQSRWAPTAWLIPDLVRDSTLLSRWERSSISCEKTRFVKFLGRSEPPSVSALPRGNSTGKRSKWRACSHCATKMWRCA